MPLESPSPPASSGTSVTKSTARLSLPLHSKESSSRPSQSTFAMSIGSEISLHSKSNSGSSSSVQTVEFTPLRPNAVSTESHSISSSIHHATTVAPAPKIGPTQSSTQPTTTTTTGPSSSSHASMTGKTKSQTSASPSITFIFASGPNTTVFITSQAIPPSDSSSHTSAHPTGSFRSDLVGGNSFWSKKGAQAGVFTAAGCIALGIMLYFLIRRRRKQAAERRRKFSQATYVNGMAQRRSFYDDPSTEVTWPSFAALPRNPSVPPRRRPVPEYIPEHFYPNDSTSEAAGLSISIPPKSAIFLSPSSIRPSPASTTTNPFSDPQVPSIASDVPLLHRTLRTDSTGHGDDASIHSHAASSAPSTPSFYPPSLPAIDENRSYSFNHSSTK